MNKTVILFGGLAAIGLLAMGGKKAGAAEPPKSGGGPGDKPSPCPPGSSLDPQTGLCVPTASPSPKPQPSKPAPKPGPVTPKPSPTKPAPGSTSGFDCASATKSLVAAQAAIQAAAASGDYLSVATQTNKASDLIARMTAEGCSFAGITSPVTAQGCPEGQVPYNGRCVPMEWVGMTPAPQGQGPALPRCPDDGSNPGYDCVDAQGIYRFYGQAAAQQNGGCPEGQIPVMGPNGYPICQPYGNAGLEKAPEGQGPQLPPCPDNMTPDYDCIDAQGNFMPYGQSPRGLQGVTEGGGEPRVQGGTENGGAWWNPFS